MDLDLYLYDPNGLKTASQEIDIRSLVVPSDAWQKHMQNLWRDILEQRLHRIPTESGG